MISSYKHKTIRKIKEWKKKETKKDQRTRNPYLQMQKQIIKDQKANHNSRENQKTTCKPPCLKKQI